MGLGRDRSNGTLHVLASWYFGGHVQNLCYLHSVAPHSSPPLWNLADLVPICLESLLVHFFFFIIDSAFVSTKLNFGMQKMRI